MAPGNNERHPSHSGTGTIPKTKVRNNCNVPQEAAVTPTRRDMATNMVSTSLDWVPVSEYNTRPNYNQSRKHPNNTSDHELTHLENAVAFEGGLGRFVPVRPQPRALPLTAHNQHALAAHAAADAHDDTVSAHSAHQYAHHMQNGVVPHSNHAAAAVMIVNPTTPNALVGNMSQPFNASNQTRNNLSRNLNPARNTLEHPGSNNTPPPPPPQSGGARAQHKAVNLINNMYDPGVGAVGQGGAAGHYNNINDNNHSNSESARALGEALVAACPDAAAVERRLGQIREYIRVTSSLVDTMRNSEDEAFINHTKEEYDELVQMVMKLKESESKLEHLLTDKEPDNEEVPADEPDETNCVAKDTPIETNQTVAGDGWNTVTDTNTSQDVDKSDDVVASVANTVANNVHLKKVTNIENEQINNSLQNIKTGADDNESTENRANETVPELIQIEQNYIDNDTTNDVIQIQQIESTPYSETNEPKPESTSNEDETMKVKNDDDDTLNAILRENILSCVEKVARIEEMKQQSQDGSDDHLDQDMVTTSRPRPRPMSVQSNGSASAYSDNELWQNEIKNKMEMSQIRLSALKQQQKRLLKYQEEAKQQLDEMHRERQPQHMHPSPSHSHDNLNGMQQTNYARMYASNQIGVATTLPHAHTHTHATYGLQHVLSTHTDTEHAHSADDTFTQRHDNEAQETRDASVDGAVGEEEGEDSSPSEDDAALAEKHRILQMKLRDLQAKKHHMETLVSEFQKLQMATTRAASSHNNYSSSGEDSAMEETSRKFLGNKSGGVGGMKNEDPFKLMEIKAIKTALQKTKDLMRSVEHYEGEHTHTHAPGGGGGGTRDESYQIPSSSHSNLHDNKSDVGGGGGGGGGGSGSASASGWSTEGSARNTLGTGAGAGTGGRQQRHKLTNEHRDHQQPTHQSQPQPPQHQPQPPQQSHEDNIASLQDLAQELRLETERIMGERSRITQLVANKEMTRKHKKVNEESAGCSGGGGVAVPAQAPGPAERKQMALRALLADKQRELEALINKQTVNEGVMRAELRQRALLADKQRELEALVNKQALLACVESDMNMKRDCRAYGSDDGEEEEQLPDCSSQRDAHSDMYRGGAGGGGDSVSMRTLPPSLLGSAYGSDSDSASRSKCNQRTRSRRRAAHERHSDDVASTAPLHPPPAPPHAHAHAQPNNVRIDPRHEHNNINVNMPTPMSPIDSPTMSYPHGAPPPPWSSKSQHARNNQSQTMDRLMSFPPSMPNFNVMMPLVPPSPPYVGGGMATGCACGCALWAAWTWQQVALQQREIHQLRDQLHNLEERWRSENASHTLNNQVPPGNRANNYWDNFRSYSRQNLLSASNNNKTNADGQQAAAAAAGTAHNPPQPLVERSHNALRHTARAASPSIPPKRNTNAATSSAHAHNNASTHPHYDEPPSPNPRRTNVAYERSLSFSSAPDVLNVNQHPDDSTHSTNTYTDEPCVSNVNINRHDLNPHSFRNLNFTNPIPEIIQSHANNLNTSNKRKSSTKLPAKNSTNRRNLGLDYSQTSNINIASSSTSDAPNPNLASTSRATNDKATSKLFDLLRENVYTEVTTLIGVNESHPDFLIQLFRELQLISSDPLRQRVLQSIRGVLTQYSPMVDNELPDDESRPDAVSTTSDGPTAGHHDCDSLNPRAVQIDNRIVRFLLVKSEEVCTSELLETLAVHIVNSVGDTRLAKQRLYDLLLKYEGMRVCDVSSDIIENLPMLLATITEGDECEEVSESVTLQDVAGCLMNADSQLHQYDMWPGHVHVADTAGCSQEEDKVDLISSEMLNGDLAEADQTHSEAGDGGGAGGEGELAEGGGAEGLPDVVDTDEVTPTEIENPLN